MGLGSGMRGGCKCGNPSASKSSQRSHSSSSARSKPSTRSLAQDLEILHELFEKGALSASEYQAAKNRLINP